MMPSQRPKYFYLCLLVFWTSGFADPGAALQQGEWQRIGRNIEETEITNITLHPNHPATLFVSTPHNIYRSEDQGNNFKSILLFSGPERQVNQIYIPAATPDAVYVATDAGIYKNLAGQLSWETALTQGSPENKYCLALLSGPGRLYAGTLAGLLVNDFGGPIWRHWQDALNRKPIFLIEQDTQYSYFVTGHEVYRENKQTRQLDKVFSTTASEQEAALVEGEEEATVLPKREISFFKVIPGKPSQAYLIIKSGIFLSNDQGAHWERIASDSLSLEEATSLILLPGADGQQSLILGTTKGVFLFQNNRWTPLYKGMETNQINALAFDGNNFLYAATDRGIFLLQVQEALALASAPQISLPQYQKIAANLEQEPSIQNVHHWAIDYAEVHPNKIKGWRMAARNKAFLPTLSLDVDRDATEYYHWDTGPNPDKLVKGLDFMDWGVSVSWNLGELIWNNDQTSIDSRSKLMVELRESVLDQVTRLYFERKRLQAELLAAAVEPQFKVEKKMRLEELTALIDGFTGGEFSEQLNKSPGHNVTKSQGEK